MLGGTLARPVLVGIISWTGPRCGEDKLPSVSAEVSHYADFLLAAAPVWAPTATGPVTITRSGATLTCSASWSAAPDEVRFRWRRRVRGKTAYEFVTIGSGPTYTVKAKDERALLECGALASNAGGRSEAPPTSVRG
jgi:hypothetical protein